MSKQVPWTERTLAVFIEKGMLTEDEIMIMTTRCKGWTRQQQAMRLCMSVSSVDKIIARLKVKYDNVQKECPDLLPPRKFSVSETYMDEH